MGRESSGVVRFDIQGPPSRSNEDSKTYNSLIIGHRGLG